MFITHVNVGEWINVLWKRVEMTEGSSMVIKMDKVCQRGSTEGTAVATHRELQSEAS
jgi:hypothetical protein